MDQAEAEDEGVEPSPVRADAAQQADADEGDAERDHDINWRGVHLPAGQGGDSSVRLWPRTNSEISLSALRRVPASRITRRRITVFAIFFSACVAAYEAVVRLIDPRDVEHLGALAAAGLIGYAGNWLAAIVRTNAGRTLDSPALSWQTVRGGQVH